MTHPESLNYANDGHIADRLHHIRSMTIDTYGPGAEFAYKTSNGYAMMTLDAATAICGRYIAQGSDEMVMAALVEMHATAELIKQKDERLAEHSRTLGRQAVERVTGEKA